MSKSKDHHYQSGADHERLVALRRAIAASWILAGIAAFLLVVGPAAASAAEAAVVALQHEIGAVGGALHGSNAAVDR
jgi:hypothetical protein